MYGVSGQCVAFLVSVWHSNFLIALSTVYQNLNAEMVTAALRAACWSESACPTPHIGVSFLMCSCGWSSGHECTLVHGSTWLFVLAGAPLQRERLEGTSLQRCVLPLLMWAVLFPLHA